MRANSGEASNFLPTELIDYLFLRNAPVPGARSKLLPGRGPCVLGVGSRCGYPRGRSYCSRLKILVWPPPTSVALSWLIATTLNSPYLSPTKSVLPLIIADGRFGL